jgi:hypothetical protein
MTNEISGSMHQMAIANTRFSTSIYHSCVPNSQAATNPAPKF